MGYHNNSETLSALKDALRKIENDHESNPATPQLREILLKRIADLEEPEEEESAK